MGLAKLFNCGKCGRNLGEPSSSTIYLHKKYGYCHRVCPKRPRRAKQGRIAKPKEQDTSLRVDWDEILRRQKAGTIVNEDSRIYLDGREKLEGEDYKARAREVLARDGGKCQWPCVRFGEIDVVDETQEQICGAPANEHPHHIKKRSKGRDDRAENLMAICDAHHKAAHPEHQARFSGSKR